MKLGSFLASVTACFVGTRLSSLVSASQDHYPGSTDITLGSGDSGEVPMQTMPSEESDPSSIANYHSFVTTSIKLDWSIDFDTSKISGAATLTMDRKRGDNVVILDCSFMNIFGVKDLNTGDSLKYEYSPKGGKFGGALRIMLGDSSSSKYVIQIEYETTKESTALQWLTPVQTLGKKYPYLFSQAQAIHARTMLPCQDTPAIKAPFSATVKVVAPLVVVMSANERRQIVSDHESVNVFEFRQTQPIPSYLIAIGAGDIVAKQIGPRSVVWSEQQVSEQAAYEFGEAESFITTAEKLVGPYVWGRYDILLLPPSFPYGGMENPCLTFVTPSILAGDRSLVDVIAHEISHSWTGNLVSCRNWEHFWLNEGFTMFLERKILSRLHGESWRQFNSIVGLADLRESIAKFSNQLPATALVTDLTGIDPDDYFSTVPYEKGYTFLYYLEELVGGPKIFEPFFYAFIREFAGQSIDSYQFKHFILEYFRGDMNANQKLQDVDWELWFKGTGMPPYVPKYDEVMMLPCQELAEAWMTNNLSKRSLFNTFTPAQKAMFLDSLIVKASHISSVIVNQLGEAYALGECTNVEVLLKWHLLVIRTRTESAYAAAAKFATQHGRMKYCVPVLRELFTAGGYGRELALSTFEKNKSFYHPIAVQVISKALGLG